jgi:hypothetical protein
MYVTVVGGGNSTPIFAALAADAGHTVAILTRRPADWDANDVGFVNDDEGYMGGKPELRVKIALVTADPAECIPQSDLIFLAGLPIHHNPEVLGRIRPHMDMSRRVFVGSICAYGGFNWVASEALGPGEYSLFGTQLIPWCCGTKEYGRTGAVFGAKRLLRIATEGEPMTCLSRADHSTIMHPHSCVHSGMLQEELTRTGSSLSSGRY